MAKTAKKTKPTATMKHPREDAARAEQRALARVTRIQKNTARLSRQLEAGIKATHTLMRDFAIRYLEGAGFHVLTAEAYAALKAEVLQS